jgi:predicted DNA-binding transcriptional regulator AlpA
MEMQRDRLDWGVLEVAHYLGKEVSWVYNNHKRVGLPFVKVGIMLRANSASVRAWAAERMPSRSAAA